MRTPRLKVSTRKSNKIDSQNYQQAAYGPEPQYGPKMFLLGDSEYRKLLGQGLDWYNAMSSDSEQKQWFLEYLRNNNYNTETLMKLDKVSDSEFRNSGSLARMDQRGFKFSGDSLEIYVQDHIYRLLAIYEYINKRNPVIIKPKPLFNPRVSNAILKINECIDIFLESDEFPEEPEIFLDECGITKTDKDLLIKKYTGLFSEIKKAIDGSDPEYIEGYQNLNKSQLSRLREFIVGIATYSPSLEVEQKVIKTKPRKKKIKSPDQILRKFKYLEYDPELKIKSEKPSGFIGAQLLIIYHTDKRKLGVFYATDDNGLTVSGSSIRNFNEETSFSKTIRKPHEIIPQIMNSNKVPLRQLIEGIKSKKQILRSSISDKTLLLRIY